MQVCFCQHTSTCRDAEFLELLEATAFDFFWRETSPANGLVKDRSTTNSFCSIAATGFGLTAIGIGIGQGPIPIMAENHRTGSDWRRFLRNDVVRRGLERAGITQARGGAAKGGGF